jgi:hypothetical protein
MDTPSLKYIMDEVEKMAAKIHARKELLPTYGYSTDGAHPHIEIDRTGQMHYVIVERGSELDRRITKNIETLFYWIFSKVTFSMAAEFELNNRIESQDCRRMLFAKQEELLGILNIEWQEEEYQRHQNILEKRPFRD